VTAVAVPARADTVAPVATPAATSAAPSGAETLGRAREAWDKGDFDSSEPLYKEALDRGGLSVKESLDCYIHLGAARAVMGRKRDALVAFRRAALMEPRFVVPSEAGKKAMQLANQARREEAKIGPFQLKGDIPESIAAQKPFRVGASIDATHAALITKIGVFAKDPSSDKSFEKSDLAATNISWELPATIAIANATLTVRVDGLDAHDNRLVSVEKHVRVGPGAAEPVAVVPVPAPTTVPGPAAATQALPKEVDKDKGEKKGGGFWASPWPYVLGGVALAAGGAAVYLGTRPTDDVSVGAASVRVR
jgi:hypothetical protein